METLDQTDFDLVVLGTGLVESIVAAAAAKAGRSVLQLDPGSRYGGAWATLHLDELLQELAEAGAAAGPGAEHAHSLTGACVLRRPGAALGPSREFNLDLAPKALYGVGPMIALLLGSGAHHYAEFKLVQGSYLYGGGGALLPVPSSRAEVFRDRSLAPLQKRTLMRFLKACTDAMRGEGPLHGCFDGRPFAALMQREGLGPQLQRFLAQGVLLLQRGAEQVPAEEALRLLRRYVESAGRYGPAAGPLLTPMYGCGELPQAFCRVAAVAGAVQVLRCPVDGLHFDDEHVAGGCAGVALRGGQAVRCRHLAGGAEGLGEEWLRLVAPALQRVAVHRCVAVLDAPLRPGEQQTLVAFPPGSLASGGGGGGGGGGGASAVWGLCLCHSTAVCPQGRWVLHLWAAGEEGGGEGGEGEGGGEGGGCPAAAALRPALEALAECAGLECPEQVHQEAPNGAPEDTVRDEAANASASDGEAAAAAAGGGSAARPRALLAAFFTAASSRMVLAGEETPGWPPNVALCPGPGPEVALCSAVDDAKRCYWGLYPGDAAHPFPLDPEAAPEEGPEGGADSDEEALEALQAALGGAPAAAAAAEEVPEAEAIAAAAAAAAAPL